MEYMEHQTSYKKRKTMSIAIVTGIVIIPGWSLILSKMGKCVIEHFGAI
jgi:hypothetical protein